RTGCWYRVASPSQLHIPDRHSLWARDVQVNVPVRRGLQRRYQGISHELSPQTPEFLCGDNYDFIAPMHGDMLWAFAANAPHQFAEPCLGVLKQPMARQGGWAFGLRFAWVI